MRNNGIILAAGFRPVVAYLRTHRNPADAPSRKQPPPETKRAATCPNIFIALATASRGHSARSLLNCVIPQARASTAWPRILWKAAANTFAGWPMRGLRIGEAPHPGPPKKIPNTGRKHERKLLRAGICLNRHQVQQYTWARYERAMRFFFAWM